MSLHPRLYRAFPRLYLALALFLTAASAHAGQTLNVGLYPWVPRLDQFKEAIQQSWATQHPDVALNFLGTDVWDGGYHKNPPASADVYVFDAMFLNTFKEMGNISPLTSAEVQDQADFFDYAIDGVRNGDEFLAIPMLGCANLLFYHQDDTALAQANTVSALKQTLGSCTYTSMIPPDRRGLMIDMQGSSTAATRYVDSATGVQNQFPPQLPATPAQIDPNTMGMLRSMMTMASYRNATEAGDNTYNRNEWFSQGYGRAVVGYSEAMSAMNDAARATVAFKVLPSANNPQAPNLFFSDLVAVNSTTVARGTRDLSVDLANTIANATTLMNSIDATATDPLPQYLLPARPSVFDALAADFPKYAQLKTMVEQANPVLFAMDSNARQWFDNLQDAILLETRTDYACGCDYDAGQSIPDNQSAPQICQATCADHGGWNGNWTNQSPAAQNGKSVCGCNQCPTPDTAMAPATPRMNDGLRKDRK